MRTPSSVPRLDSLARSTASFGHTPVPSIAVNACQGEERVHSKSVLPSRVALRRFGVRVPSAGQNHLYRAFHLVYVQPAKSDLDAARRDELRLTEILRPLLTSYHVLLASRRARSLAIMPKATETASLNPHISSTLLVALESTPLYPIITHLNADSSWLLAPPPPHSHTLQTPFLLSAD